MAQGTTGCEEIVNIDLCDLEHEMIENKLNLKIISKIIGRTTSVNGLNLQYCKDDISTNIKILLEGDLKELNLYMMIESICKGIDLEDCIMDDILFQSSKIANLIKRRLELEKPDIHIHMDALVIDENNVNEWEDNKIKQYMIKSCKEAASKWKHTFNYCNELFVFGTKGKRITKLMEEMNIATIARSNGGYLITFLDKKIDGCNEAIHILAQELSKIGVPSLSISRIVLDHYWQ